MSNTQHTPGRWTFSYDGAEEITVDCGEIYGAATMPVRGEDYPEAEQLANAALIAAAPDMFAALESIWRDCMAARMLPAKSKDKRYTQMEKVLARIEELSTAAANKAKG